MNVANILETWKEASRLEQDLREALLDLREEGKRTSPTTEWREAVSKDKRPAVRVLFKEWARAESDLEKFLAHPVVFDSDEAVGHVVTVKYFARGVKDKPRHAQFKDFRPEFDR